MSHYLILSSVLPCLRWSFPMQTTEVQAQLAGSVRPALHTALEVAP